MQVKKASGVLVERDDTKIQAHCKWFCEGLEDQGVCQSELESSIGLQFYDGMPTSEIADALITTAKNLISVEKPGYDKVAAKATIQKIYKQVTGGEISYPTLSSFIAAGIGHKQLDPRLGDGRFDLNALNSVIIPNNDFRFDYLGIQTIADRYLLTEPRKAGGGKKVYEMPQHFWMRVAMGLAINEDNPTLRAAQFYLVMSNFDYCPSTPTLFNAGTMHAQMSSCYVGFVPDDLKGIFDLGITQNAMLSKFAGGIGTDWTSVRANGSVIKSTNGISNGVVPFLKIYNNTAIAVNQGGKRKGAFAPYLELWHADIYDFMDLRLQSGEENMRCHDIFPAAWIPDLFMERKDEGGDWSLFCPSDVPELHDLYGAAFEAKYKEYEASGVARKTVKAMDLWRHLLDKLVRTGHPWITFKDNCNERNPQAHCGVIHNSNLCTEITLNNSVEEVAVCNLGSIVLSNHMTANGHIDSDKLKRTVQVATRMLDNVIDLNYYPTETARVSNLRHRPVGLGVMGYAEALVQCGIAWESVEHLEWADELFEQISYFAIDASADLAIERGAYESFPGSTWSQGKLTIDTVKEGHDNSTHVFAKQEWQNLRDKVKATGIRNSNITAIAPTATIANIIGTTECIQTINERVVIKENLSGNFMLMSPLAKYARQDLVKTVWEVDQIWSIDAAAVRQKWIDQSQSLNIYRKSTDTGRVLDSWYSRCHKKGVKTSYYLRNNMEESAKFGHAPAPVVEETSLDAPVQGNTDEPFICEACQ